MRLNDLAFIWQLLGDFGNYLALFGLLLVIDGTGEIKNVI